jgi:hypothetical protein
MHDPANGLRRISLPRTPVNKGKRRAGAYSSSVPSCEISAIILAPPELFYALLHERYLALLEFSGPPLQLRNPNRRRHRRCGGRNRHCGGRNRHRAGAGPLWLPRQTARW